MGKIQKHRLVLLLGIFVALVFFYLGLNTWMSSQEQRNTPPPVVRVKPPVQIKPTAEAVKPQTPEPAEGAIASAAQPETKEAPEPKVIKISQPKQEKPEPAKKEKTEEKKTEKTAKREVKQEEKKKEKKAEKKATEKPKRNLREYVVQIGAFRSKENAAKSLDLAKKSGFDAFLIEEEGMYKVRVRVKAKSLFSALREVRSRFKNAFVVK